MQSGVTEGQCTLLGTRSASRRWHETPSTCIPRSQVGRAARDPGMPRARLTYLQAHVEHHGSHDVEVGKVDAQPPSQVKEDEQGAGQPLAEDPIGAGGGRARQPDSQTRQSRRHIETRGAPTARPPSLSAPRRPRPPPRAAVQGSAISGSEETAARPAGGRAAGELSLRVTLGKHLRELPPRSPARPRGLTSQSRPAPAQAADSAPRPASRTAFLAREMRVRTRMESLRCVLAPSNGEADDNN